MSATPLPGSARSLATGSTSMLANSVRAEAPERVAPFRQLVIDGVRYRFDHQIATGSSSVLYGTVDEWGRALVLKAYSATLARDLWRQEVRALRRFHGPECVALMAAFENDAGAYLVLERFGHSLGRLRNVDPAVRTALALRVLCPVLSLLHRMHHAGWVHGDVNPGNVLIDLGPDNTVQGVKLCDLALARPVDAPNAATGVALWCPAPEQLHADGRKTQPHTDVYHAAALALEILQGAPLAATAQAVMNGRLAEQARSVDARLGPILAEALAVQPEARPSALELWRRLNRAFNGLDGALAPVQAARAQEAEP